jgi:mono/diheme cytochrome c family protein
MDTRGTLRGMIGAGALAAVAMAAPAGAEVAPVYLNQGWSAATRNAFYIGDQGSQIMPLSWIEALKQPNGAPFLADSLGRYGYLANPDKDARGLPVGFTAAGAKGKEQFGMTCSACHTRQIEVGGLQYRIDGGPGIVDFQPFLADLDTAVNTVLTDDAAFKDFAKAVLGGNPSVGAQAKLHQDVAAWFLRYDTLVKQALPPAPWGPSRLDAVSMIFDRLTGLDIGPPPSYLIPANIIVASAPVRYPFLWNAPIQDFTQWPGFAANGDALLALARNLGEVYGVFADFHPVKDLFGVNYLKINSANFKGLGDQEDRIRKLGPPKWQWPLDQTLVAAGKAIFDRPNEQGGCTGCHGITDGPVRPIFQKTWNTPILDVGTDTREYQILGTTVQTGVLEGAGIPPLPATDKAFSVLETSVVWSILQHFNPFKAKTTDTAKVLGAKALASPKGAELQTAFVPPSTATSSATPSANASPPANAYESRVLQGIWAAAPYLHNGSVRSLADLLKPAAERAVSFKIGPAYDLENVGLAAEQTKFNYVLTTTGCDELNSGDSRCGHEYGTTLSAQDKRALLEYLKSL